MSKIDITRIEKWRWRHFVVLAISEAVPHCDPKGPIRIALAYDPGATSIPRDCSKMAARSYFGTGECNPSFFLSEARTALRLTFGCTEAELIAAGP